MSGRVFIVGKPAERLDIVRRETVKDAQEGLNGGYEVMLPVIFTEDGIAAYVKPVENFLDRIHKRSKHNPNLPFTRIHKALSWPRLLTYAALRVLGNQGAYTAGIDKISKGVFMRTFEYQIQRIRKIIKNYDPLAILRVYIPKKNGDKRPLGIPALRDRVIQESLRMILEAIYEPKFSPNSMGFRLGLSIQDVRRKCFDYLQPHKKMHYVIEFDIEKFFDNVDHDTLLKIIKRTIRDGKTVKILHGIMKAQIFESGSRSVNLKGVPQGGVISPLLANIYLNEFDTFVESLKEDYARKYVVKRAKSVTTEWRRKQLGGTIGYIRYADDSVLFWNGRRCLTNMIVDRCETFLREVLKLKLNRDKTHITFIEDGFQFVGFHFSRRRTSRSYTKQGIVKYPVVDVPTDNLRRTVSGITEYCRDASTRGWDLRYTTLKLNQLLDGFYNCYKFTTFASIRLGRVFSHAMTQFWYFLKRKGYNRNERTKFKRRINGRVTYGFGKYSLRTPPSGVYDYSRVCNMLVDENGTVLVVDRYERRKKRLRIKREYPNDPIIPLNQNWAADRMFIFERDGGKCVYCGRPASHIDHIFTKEEARCDRRIRKLRDKRSYLRSVCKSCHVRRHGGELSWDRIADYISKFSGDVNSEAT